MENFKNVQVENLNIDQSLAYKKIMNAIKSENDEKQKLFFVEGPAGTGKTYLLNTILKMCDENEIDAVAVALTHTCADLLYKGRTAHSQFILPWTQELHNNAASGVEEFSFSAHNIRRAKIIIFDQINYFHKIYIEQIIDRLLRELMKNNVPFGGKMVVIAGDFRQLMPIKGFNLEEQRTESLMHSNILSSFEQLHLFKNQRFSDIMYYEYLVKIGNDEIPLEIPSACIVSSVNQLVDDVFGSEIKINDLRIKPQKRIILVRTNKEIDIIRDECLSRFSKMDLMDNEWLKYFPFAKTIHCSQGQDFDHVGLYLSELIFTHGQLYVALSRVRHIQNLKVFLQKIPLPNPVVREILP